MKENILPLLAVSVLLACGCSTASFNVRITLPSRAEAMQERQRVVMGDISGPWGYELARMLSESIAGGGYHTMIDRTNEDLTARELERAMETGGYVDPSQVGVVGATVVISGTTERGAYSIERERRTEKKCVERNEDGECTRTRRVHYFDQRESCTSTVAARVTRVTDNVVLFERGFPGYAGTSQTTEGDWPPRHEEQLCSDAFYNAASEVTTWLTPFSTVVRLKFRKIRNSPSTDKAIEFVRASMFDRADTLFEGALSDPGLDEEAAGWARYNIAVVKWALGEYRECVDQSVMALEILGAKNDIVEVRNSCVQYVK